MMRQTYSKFIVSYRLKTNLKAVRANAERRFQTGNTLGAG